MKIIYKNHILLKVENRIASFLIPSILKVSCTNNFSLFCYSLVMLLSSFRITGPKNQNPRGQHEFGSDGISSYERTAERAHARGRNKRPRGVTPTRDAHEDILVLSQPLSRPLKNERKCSLTLFNIYNNLIFKKIRCRQSFSICSRNNHNTKPNEIEIPLKKLH